MNNERAIVCYWTLAADDAPLDFNWKTDQMQIFGKFSYTCINLFSENNI